jgi:hypothetical protein
MTFTVEHAFDESIVTLLDDTACLDDVVLYLGEDKVDIVQFDQHEGIEIHNQVTLTTRMFRELLAAMNTPEGLYRSEE